ncbi:MAG TPA: hypothetical protein VM867_13780 [Xanthobacteraceae bacterium]|jgi:hypothetical protein|nr:hypothetical protein [Xanthobacteraceae bacterium]
MRIVCLGILCVALGGCSFALDESSGVFAAAPGKYDFLDCKSLSQRAQAAAAREAELSGLMERANRDAFGPVVSTLVYRDELNSVRADQYALRKAADEKRCTPDIRPQSTSLGPMH